MKPFLKLVCALSLVTPALSGCRQPEATAPTVAQSNGAVVAFASGVAALELLDELHARDMAAVGSPTDEQMVLFRERSARLRRLRDTLALARSWLAGSGDQEVGRKALHDAADGLRIIVAELRSRGQSVPRAVDAGLAALQMVY